MTEQTNLNAVAGSQWGRSFTFYNNGVLIDLTGLTWEFTIRRSVTDAGTPLVAVTVTPGAQGSITVDLPSSTLVVSLTPAATALLGKSACAHGLWSNPTDAATKKIWVLGVFNTALAATP